MKRHSTDLVSLTFGVIFAGIAAWWLIGRYLLNLRLDVPNLGLIIAAALILLGLLGVVGSLRREARPDRDDEPDGLTAAPFTPPAPVRTDTTMTNPFLPADTFRPEDTYRPWDTVVSVEDGTRSEPVRDRFDGTEDDRIRDDDQIQRDEETPVRHDEPYRLDDATEPDTGRPLETDGATTVDDDTETSERDERRS